MNLHTTNTKKEYLQGKHLAGQGKLVSKLAGRPGGAGKRYNHMAMLSNSPTTTRRVPWEKSQEFVISRNK